MSINQNNFFDPHVSCRPTWMMASQHIFKSGLTKINLGGEEGWGGQNWQ